MTQTVIGSDGVKHQFPDDATPDEMNQAVFGAPPPNPADQPSYASQLVGKLAMPLRAFNKGLTGNLWDPAVGAAKSVFDGQPVGQGIKNEEQRTSQAEQQMGPGASIALEGAGTLAGPGKLAQTERAAQLATSGIGKFATRLVGGAAEGGAYAGEQAFTEGQPTLPAVTKGAAIGGGAGVTLPLLTSLAGKFGGPPPPPTAEELAAGSGFKSQQTYDTADKLRNLQNMQYNTTNTGSSLPTQVHSLLSKDIETGQSQADKLGYSAAEQNALAQVGKTTPVSSFVQQHPRVSMSVLGPISELPALAIAAKGNPEGAIIPGLMGGAVDIGAYKGTQYLANKGAQDALDTAKRVIAGQPTQTDWQNTVNNPQFGQALQALLFNNTLGQ